MNLNEVRDEIDTINTQMLDLFIKRLELCSFVAEYKKNNNLPINDSKREEEILQKINKLSDEKYSKYTEELFRQIFAISKEYQKDILEKK